jgi:hypothetical protein
MKLRTRLFGKNFLVREFVEGIEKELPKGMNIENYYSIIHLCLNCRHSNSIWIKKGVHVNDIITHVKCQNCECRLEKENK